MVYTCVNTMHAQFLACLVECNSRMEVEFGWLPIWFILKDTVY